MGLYEKKPLAISKWLRFAPFVVQRNYGAAKDVISAGTGKWYEATAVITIAAIATRAIKTISLCDVVGRDTGFAFRQASRSAMEVMASSFQRLCPNVDNRMSRRHRW
jgi:hypothetical protein